MLFYPPSCLLKGLIFYIFLKSPLPSLLAPSFHAWKGGSISLQHASLPPFIPFSRDWSHIFFEKSLLSLFPGPLPLRLTFSTPCQNSIFYLPLLGWLCLLPGNVTCPSILLHSSLRGLVSCSTILHFSLKVHTSFRKYPLSSITALSLHNLKGGSLVYEQKAFLPPLIPFWYFRYLFKSLPYHPLWFFSSILLRKVGVSFFW